MAVTRTERGYEKFSASFPRVFLCLLSAEIRTQYNA